ncbi:ribokinase [Pseudorhodoferax sp.]|uniref:ribokinase n=1 Tax=Pseudorhodoferax sp. TaxID=1993553 RepID=UPI002DD64F81|nr:ribokinase [Pseudorhodoferax sp.]
MTSTRVLVAGSANLDLVVRAPHIPAPGETVLGHSFATLAGGKGANQAVACARAGGMPTQMLLALGDDAAAAVLEASLGEAGVDLQVQRVAVPTGQAFICVSDAGDNAITVAAGANLELRPGHLPPLAGFSHLLLQLETPLDTVTAYARAAHDAGLAAVLNGAPAQVLPPALLAALDLLIVNEGELATISGHDGGVDDALAALPLANVVVTLGGQGARARCAGTWLQQPGFAIEVADTTAAGDTFCGALVAERARGADWPQALRVACAAAALACTRPGAQSSIPARAEVLQFLQQQA